MTCLLPAIMLSGVCTPAPVDSWPVLLTYYTDELDGVQGNGDGYFASMIPVSDDWSYQMAACPRHYFGGTVDIPAAGLSLYCGDNFGTWDGLPVETVVCEQDGCYYRIDVFISAATLERDGLPYWNVWSVDATFH